VTNYNERWTNGGHRMVAERGWITFGRPPARWSDDVSKIAWKQCIKVPQDQINKLAYTKGTLYPTIRDRGLMMMMIH
jgi:hypothetical protein